MMETNNTSFENIIKLKILILGDMDVGKTSLVHKYKFGTKLKFSESTIMLDITHKTIDIDEKSVVVSIWDTAGKEKHHALSPQFYRNTSAVMLVYNITKRVTFDSLKSWLEEYEKYDVYNNTPKVIIGNKSDCVKDRQVTWEEGKKFADKLQIPFYETSKNNSVIEECFMMLVKKLLISKTYEIYASSDSIFIGQTPEMKRDKKRFSCCSGNTTHLHFSLGKPI